jgi:hypothetical protein
LGFGDFVIGNFALRSKVERAGFSITNYKLPIANAQAGAAILRD